MTTHQILLIAALCCYAVYRQTVRSEVDGKSRFKLAAIYAIVGFVAGGIHAPASPLAWTLLLGGLAMSAAVGYVRGRLTTLSVENGAVYAQGTKLTIALFLGLVLVKFALGAAAYMAGAAVAHSSGFGQVMVLIAVMVAFQAEIVWQRAKALLGMHAGVPAAQGA
ncbi:MULTISPECIES: DUF1453 family protein [Cupriavidus]|uniref:DUF1453 family protein n=1 Tax=Cupriavidus TaxID=106589 RepID=UPI00037BB77D|nr:MULTISPECIES: DUF1453 family protein [Cupriavidus]